MNVYQQCSKKIEPDLLLKKTLGILFQVINFLIIRCWKHWRILWGIFWGSFFCCLGLSNWYLDWIVDMYKEFQKFSIKYFCIFQEYSCIVLENYWNWKKSQGYFFQGIFVTTVVITTSRKLVNLWTMSRNLRRVCN